MAATGPKIAPDAATALGVDAHAAPRLSEEFKSRSDSDNYIPANATNVAAILSAAGDEQVSEEDASILLEAASPSNGKLDFQQVCRMYVTRREAVAKGGTKRAGAGVLQQVSGAVGVHTYAEEERVAFAEHLNNCFKDDAWLRDSDYMPIDTDSPTKLFETLRDGIVLSKLINMTQPETIDERSLNVPKHGKKLNPWETKENLNLVINSAKAIGCHIVNIHAADFMNTVAEHKEYLVLGVIWQVVKMQLLQDVNLRERPELAKLLREDEELADFLKLPAEEILLRWMNYHMNKSGAEVTVKNFSNDVKSGVVYAHLLDSIWSKDGSVKEEILSKTDARERAAAVVDKAKELGAETFIQARDIVSGNKRLNLAFCAQLFNENPGLVEDETELQKLKDEFEAAGLMEDDESDSREERTFRMWMNSLNLHNGALYLQDLIGELDDGIVLLDAIDHLKPGTVDQKKVNRPKEGKRFHKLNAVANCNYAVDLGKELGFSLPGIGGVDINARNRKLVLGFVWQLMRMQVLETLKSVGGGSLPQESEIVTRANQRVQEAGKSTKITGFKDKSISKGLFLLDLLASIEPRAINPDLVTPGEDAEQKKNNARYVLSVARKIGTTVFLTWEDIVDVKPKMVMTLVASILAVAAKYTAP